MVKVRECTLIEFVDKQRQLDIGTFYRLFLRHDRFFEFAVAECAYVVLYFFEDSVWDVWPAAFVRRLRPVRDQGSGVHTCNLSNVCSIVKQKLRRILKPSWGVDPRTLGFPQGSAHTFRTEGFTENSVEGGGMRFAVSTILRERPDDRMFREKVERLRISICLVIWAMVSMTTVRG